MKLHTQSSHLHAYIQHPHARAPKHPHPHPLLTPEMSLKLYAQTPTLTTDTRDVTQTVLIPPTPTPTPSPTPTPTPTPTPRSQCVWLSHLIYALTNAGSVQKRKRHAPHHQPCLHHITSGTCHTHTQADTHINTLPIPKAASCALKFVDDNHAHARAHTITSPALLLRHALF